MLQSIDCICTYIVLANGGFEANPIVRTLLGVAGFKGLFALKILATAVVSYQCIRAKKNTDSLLVANGIMLFVCGWMSSLAWLALRQ